MPIGFAHVMSKAYNEGAPYGGPRGAGPRRSMSRRWDNVLARPFRALVTGTSPDHPSPRHEPAAAPVYVSPVSPAQPFALRTVPTRRLGTVPKLAPGKQGSGLGVPVGAGFTSLAVYGFTPIENSPATQGNFRIKIPKVPGVPYQKGELLQPTYKADPFIPATRQFNQGRSAGMWAQAHYPPQQQRSLLPNTQSAFIRRPSNVVRRQIPAAQQNVGLYTIGYPTSAAVAARLGGGPIAVLGANSQ